MELMDDLGVNGESLDLALRDLSWVHRVLGGGRATLSTLGPLIRKIYSTVNRPVKVLDAGCGGGDALAELATWSNTHRIPIELTGIDANPACLEYTRSRIKSGGVELLECDIFSKEVHWENFDIIHFGLVLHHFEEDAIVDLLQNIALHSKGYVIINDLQRSRLAYQLFRLVSRISFFSDMARNDGLISIRRGFTQDDWKKMTKRAGIEHYKMSWKWAFRYVIQIEPQNNKSFSLSK
jgi:ubiquinone/menaquinone biosynthesis C-methylase UbiE